jgi:hypothetical protein
MVHLSGKKMAKLIIDLADLDKYGLYSENVRVLELAQTQKLAKAAQEQVEVQGATGAGITEGDPEYGPV